MLDREDLPALVNERALHVVWPYLVVMVRDLTSQMGMPPVGVPTPYEFDYMLRQAGWFARPPGRARQPGAGSAIPLCVARSWPSNCSKPPFSGVSPSPISPLPRGTGRGGGTRRRAVRGSPGRDLQSRCALHVAGPPIARSPHPRGCPRRQSAPRPAGEGGGDRQHVVRRPLERSDRTSPGPAAGPARIPGRDLPFIGEFVDSISSPLPRLWATAQVL